MFNCVLVDGLGELPSCPSPGRLRILCAGCLVSVLAGVLVSGGIDVNRIGCLGCLVCHSTSASKSTLWTLTKALATEAELHMCVNRMANVLAIAIGCTQCQWHLWCFDGRWGNGGRTQHYHPVETLGPRTCTRMHTYTHKIIHIQSHTQNICCTRANTRAHVHA